jgi:hypothetical protein
VLCSISCCDGMSQCWSRQHQDHHYTLPWLSHMMLCHSYVQRCHRSRWLMVLCPALLSCNCHHLAHAGGRVLQQGCAQKAVSPVAAGHPLRW